MHQEIPADYETRQSLWIKCSHQLVCNDAPFISLSVENLGRTERLLLQMEGDLKAARQKSARDTLLMECSAHSILWIFGLYEVVRIMREVKMAQFYPLEKLFQSLEVIRIPLAKHEIKKAPKYPKKFYYPTSVWSPENGWVGWDVFNPISEANEIFFRTCLANEFLSTMAGHHMHGEVSS